MQSGAERVARHVVAALALVACTPALAADVRPFVKAGLDFGGETLVTVVFVSGDTESVKSNEGLYFGGGVSILNDAGNIETNLSVAYKLSGITASNGDIDWTMWPVEALVFYRIPQWRFGGGLAYHLNPRLEGTGVVGGLDIKFKDAAGLVLQADYLIGKSMAAGVRYTSVKYKQEGGGVNVSSGGIGGTFSYRF